MLTAMISVPYRTVHNIDPYKLEKERQVERGTKIRRERERDKEREREKERVCVCAR